ncbi:hypothetical protein HUG10_05625 [Halorarum halophilum]|uniref:Major facilitator superfamily (MFS) profile domain-containing protein n=1 Tax=Halorarum halophilum TaxID=2743090 RepID=A0A7D5K710_9EURY|nr:hypothetical protein [Halobaculum halophilum]QLG27054.1 hypothetical protein HUG10_05625 [Halobaculum halophilum]
MDGEDARALSVVVGSYGAVGVGLALAGFATADWARAQFVTGASGEAAGTFGPVFLAAAALSVTGAATIGTVVLGGVLGSLVGSRYAAPERALAVTAGGAFVGSVLAGTLAVAGVLAGVGGDGATQVYAAETALVPLLVAAVGAALAAGGCGALAASVVR